MLRKPVQSLLQSFSKNGNTSKLSVSASDRFYAQKKKKTTKDEEEPSTTTTASSGVNELTGRDYNDFSQSSSRAGELQKKGKYYENIHKSMVNKTLVQRVLFDKLNNDDFKNVDFKNPEVMKNHIDLFAREGPPELVFYEHLPDPVTVTVTGAAGQIAYSLLTRIGNGEMLGKQQMIKLKLLERPEAMKALEGVIMELKDCAFPNILEIQATDNYDEAFDGCDYAILVGAKPRGPGMERGDLLAENANLFAEQGKALNRKANKDVLVTVVGNPANTNALVCSLNARDIPKDQFSALTRLDHDRGLGLIAEKANCDVQDIHRFCIWGNHSATMYPDLTHATIKGEWALKKINDMNWVYNNFIPRVQQRGAEVIKSRGKSSAASAADATIKHIHDWVLGNSRWVSMALYSEGIYGMPTKIFSSVPVLCPGGGETSVVKGIPIDRKSAHLINLSNDELLKEREAVEHLLPSPVYRFAPVDVNKVFSKDYIFSGYKKDTGKDVETM